MAWGLRVHALLSECGLWAAPSCPRRWGALPTPSGPGSVSPLRGGWRPRPAEPRGAGCPPSLPLEVTQLKVPWEGVPQGAVSPQSHLLAQGQEQHPFLGFSGAGCRRPRHPRLPGRVCLGEGTRAADLPSRRLPGRAEGWQAGRKLERNWLRIPSPGLPPHFSLQQADRPPWFPAPPRPRGLCWRPGVGRKPQPLSPGTSARQLCAGHGEGR